MQYFTEILSISWNFASKFVLFSIWNISWKMMVMGEIFHKPHMRFVKFCNLQISAKPNYFAFYNTFRAKDDIFDFAMKYFSKNTAMLFSSLSYIWCWWFINWNFMVHLYEHHFCDIQLLSIRKICRKQRHPCIRWIPW